MQAPDVVLALTTHLYALAVTVRGAWLRNVNCNVASGALQLCDDVPSHAALQYILAVSVILPVENHYSCQRVSREDARLDTVHGLLVTTIDKEDSHVAAVGDV